MLEVIEPDFRHVQVLWRFLLPVGEGGCGACRDEELTSLYGWSHLRKIGVTPMVAPPTPSLKERAH